MIASESKAPSSHSREEVREAVIAALCRLLGAEDELRRCWAAQALGRIDGRQAAASLVAALEDPDEDVRSDAAEALAVLAGPELGGALLRSLVEDPCGAVKLAAIDGLARTRCAEAVPLLRSLVRGREAGVTWDEESFISEGWDDWLDVQAKAIEALAGMQVEEAAADILAAMADEAGQDLSELGTRALARLGRAGVAALEQLAGARDPRVRRRVMRAAAGTGHGDAERLLRKGLQDRDAEVRLVALTALAERDPQQPALAAHLADPDARVRAEAVRRCGRYHGQHLDALLDDRSGDVRLAALEVLIDAPRLSVPRLIRRLRVKLRAPDGAIAARAAELLALRAPEIAHEDLAEQLADRSRPEALRCAAVEQLARIEGEPVRRLAAYLRDPQRPVRITVLSLLTRIAGEEDDAAVEARELLLGALAGDAGEQEPAAPEDREVPEAGEGETRDAAVEPSAETDEAEAGRVEDAYPVSTLEAILGGSAPIAEEVPEESVDLTEADLEYLALATRQPRKRRVSPQPEIPAEEDVPCLAARLLGDLSGPEIAAALAARLADADRELAAAAADSLARIAARQGELPADTGAALQAACAAKERDIRLAALRALGEARGVEAIDTLIAALEDTDPFVRAEAVRALGKRGEARQACAARFTDPEPNVRLAAAEALLACDGPEMAAELARRGMAFEGYYRRRLGQLLRGTDAAAAAGCLLEDLDATTDRARCRAAIELIEELFRPEPVSEERAAGPNI